jgi:hypothetical protein
MGASRIWVEKPEGNRPLLKCRNREENRTKMDLKGIKWDSMDSLHVTQNWEEWRVPVNMVTNLQVP